ncbi:MAG: flagellar hook-associated protein FlgK [Pararhodobacter sp.]
MSINLAMNAAISGLGASTRAIEVVSSNVANAMTEGYATRQIQLSSSVVGGTGNGVRVVGVERQVDPVLNGLMRKAGGAMAGAGAQAGFWTTLEQAIGLPGDPHGLTGKVAALESALIASAARPDQDHLLKAVVDASSDLVRQLNQLEDQVQSLRHRADVTIARDVADLNQGLERVAQLNRDIVKLQAAGHSALGLVDERQAMIDSLSQIVPIKELQHTDGRIVLYTEGGQLLLDTKPAVFGFTASPAMDATMSLQNGQLNGLTINGRDVSTGPEGPLAGGRLAGNFAVRDRDAPQAQAALDAIAMDIITRFEDPAVDPSNAPGQPGLFTDLGLPFDPLETQGLAGRISVNAAVRPDAGGDLWLLRDGLGAAMPGPVGHSAQIQRWIEALQVPLVGPSGGAARSFSDSVGQSISGLSQARQAAEDRSGYATAYQTELKQSALAMGVDVDAEMQRLMLIEKAYAANTRVLQIADEMLRRMLEI